MKENNICADSAVVVKKKKSPLKIFFIVLLTIVLALVAVVGGYVLYVVTSYNRIEDKLTLEVSGTAYESEVSAGNEYTVVTQNLGFGAYTKDFTFFMDGGKESWAKSPESVRECIKAGVNTVNSFNPDFVLYQEIDFNSTRSYHINEREIIDGYYTAFSKAFAVNYHSAFLMYPFSRPHGASNSGMYTLSAYKINSAVRRSLPIPTGFSKFLDLDRCYSVSRVNVDNGKELVIYNVHLSAYGGDESIRTAQIKMLMEDMLSEYEKGNYCVCGGDFNHDFTGTSTFDLNGTETTDFGWAQPLPDSLIPAGFSKCVNYVGGVKPTCRNCDVPFKEGNFTIIVDGFIVSDNVEEISTENVVTGFTYSDHNPVKLQFKLK